MDRHQPTAPQTGRAVAVPEIGGPRSIPRTRRAVAVPGIAVPLLHSNAPRSGACPQGSPPSGAAGAEARVSGRSPATQVRCRRTGARSGDRRRVEALLRRSLPSTFGGTAASSQAPSAGSGAASQGTASACGQAGAGSDPNRTRRLGWRGHGERGGHELDVRRGAEVLRIAGDRPLVGRVRLGGAERMAVRQGFIPWAAGSAAPASAQDADLDQAPAPPRLECRLRRHRPGLESNLRLDRRLGLDRELSLYARLRHMHTRGLIPALDGGLDDSGPDSALCRCAGTLPGAAAELVKGRRRMAR